jgi:hypothetical protein
MLESPRTLDLAFAPPVYAAMGDATPLLGVLLRLVPSVNAAVFGEGGHDSDEPLALPSLFGTRPLASMTLPKLSVRICELKVELCGNVLEEEEGCARLRSDLPPSIPAKVLPE